VAEMFRVPSSLSSLNCILKDQMAILEVKLKVGKQYEKNFTNWKLVITEQF
jgi:hypothetical protein